MIAATMPGMAATVSRKMARLRTLSVVIEPRFHPVAVEVGRCEML
jgi:hypothetical protein